MVEGAAELMEKKARMEEEKTTKTDRIAELGKRKEEIEAQLELPDQTDEQKEQLTAELPKITEEIESLEAAIKEGDEELQILEEQIRTLEETPATEPPTEPPPEETAEREPSVTAPKVSPGGEKPAQPAGGPRESIVRIKTNVKAERDKLEGKIKGKEPQKKGEELAKMTSTMHDMEELVQTGYISKTELNIQKLEKKMQKAEESSAADLKRAEEELAELDELLNASGTEVEQRLRDWEKRRAAGEAAGGSNKNVIAAPALVDKGGEDEGKQQPPGPPPPTPDPKAKRVPQQEASEFPLYDSAVLVELREADERAAKAAKAIEAVREQLAVYAKKDEMTDEDIKMMEEKQKELMAKMEEFEEITKKVQHLVGLVDVASSQLGPPQRPMVPTVEGVRTAAPGARNEPEDTLPKVIVCGTGDVDKVPKIIVCEPTKAKDGKQPLYHQIQGSANQSKGDDDSPRPGRGRDEYLPQSQMDSGFPGPGGGMFPGGPMGPGMMGLGPGMMGGPGFMGGPIMMGPGFGGPGGMFGPMGPGGMMEMYSGAIPPGTMLPSGVMMPPCLPCKPKKPKKDKQKDQVCCPGEKELGELLEASLNMTEKLAVENSELEGNRYELQEAVLDKDKQHDALLIQLDSMKQELKTVKNENQFLKNMVAATKTPGDKARGDQGSCLQGLEAGKKTGGLCKKELKTSPICRVQAYKEMGLPMPRMDNKPQCPGAKFAVSMGWNENQGCRNELNKSVNCPDMKGSSNANVNFDRTNPNKCGNMGSGDTGTGHGPNCPCSCCTKLPPCKKEEMDEIVMKMEQEVKCLQNELELVQAERKGLALQKKLLNCMAENSMGNQTQNQQMCQSDSRPDCAPKQPPCNKPLVILRKPQPENLSSVELQLNSLREQYRKLQEDYNCKVEEVSMVRVEYEAAKRDALALLEKCREAEARVDDLLDRLRVIEMEKTKMAGSKDQMLELEQQLTLAKQRYREGQEELEEIKTTMQDQMLQLEEYRNKYLTAQQTVEEQRRQIDIMELENNRISEQVNLEIQRVKNQFQEKLQELTPLPDMLKATQLKLQECDQLRQLAERNVEQLLNQTDEMREQNKKLETELEDLRKHTAANTAENNNLASSLTTGEKKIEEIKSENNKLRATVARLEEVALNNDRRLDEKTHEVLQLQTQLETLREESARQVSRTKDRCEAIRRTLQSQISQLECQLAQSRAAARTAQKDRDEIRQRMQAQITSLNDNFEQAQLRIRSLQSHVNYLKSSYTNIFCPEQNTPCGPKPIDGLSTC